MMQTTSLTYNPYPDSRKVDFQFSFGIFPPDAPEIAVPTHSGGSNKTQIAQTHDTIRNVSGKYGSLEHNLFLLDDTFEAYPDSLSSVQTGWHSSAISNANKAFTSNPWIRFDFSHAESSYAFTLYFDDRLTDDYPTQVVTTAYNSSGTVIATLTTYPTEYKHIVPLTVDDYSAVRFEFVKTSMPYRRVRLVEAAFGIIYNYDAKSSTGADLRYEGNPFAETLPSNEVAVTIDNSERVYNMINPTGLFYYLEQGQYMDCDFLVGEEPVNMGRFYFTSSKSKDSGITAELTFNDRILWLDDPLYQNGASGTWTLSEAVSSILSAAGLTIETSFAGSLASYTIQKCIPQDTTCREALRLACQAAMCTCYVTRDDTLRFATPAIGTNNAEITRNQLYEDAEVTVKQSYNTVELTVSDTFAGTDEATYTASDVLSSDYTRIYAVSNPLVTDGEAVAAWILSWLKRRLTYDFRYRGNPAIDIFDTVKVHDLYDVNASTLVTAQNFHFDGGLYVDGTTIR